MTELSSLLVLAVVVEFLTEALRENILILRRLPAGWIAVALGIVLCWFTETGILQLIGEYRHPPYFDYIVTGLVVSRGSGVLHSLISALNGFARRVSLRLSQQ